MTKPRFSTSIAHHAFPLLVGMLLAQPVAGLAQQSSGPDSPAQRAAQAMGVHMGAAEAPAAAPLVSPVANSATTPGTPWPTKAALIQATREGKFAGLHKMTGQVINDAAPLIDSVLSILQQEYNISAPAAANPCGRQIRQEIFSTFSDVNGIYVETLGDSPPNFVSGKHGNIEVARARMERLGTGLCSVNVLGARQRHPYVQPFLELVRDYVTATRAWVEVRRAELKTNYAARAAQEAEARAARERAEQADREAAQAYAAELRAAKERAEAERIRAERERIQEQERRRQQVERNRVGG